MRRRFMVTLVDKAGVSRIEHVSAYAAVRTLVEAWRATGGQAWAFCRTSGTFVCKA